MTRETKYNLVFLGVFLAISLPGAVIMVKKKMRPGATPAPLSRPDPLRRRLPYMAPQATSDQVRRYVPPLTRDWLSQVDHARGGSGEFLTRDRQPAMSENRVLQVLNTEGTKASLVVWDDWHGEPPHVSADGVRGTVERFDTIEVPGHIRKELQDGGFVTPPKKILWLRVDFEQPFSRTESTQVQVRSRDVANPTAISVNLFTS